MEPDSALDDLKATLRELIEFLRRNGERPVLERMTATLKRLEAGELSATDSVRSETTGTMGSLRDLILSAGNGRRVKGSEGAANARLNVLVDQLREQAFQVRRKS